MMHSKTLENGARLLYFHRPGFHRTVFFAGFRAGGCNLAEISEDGRIQYSHPSGCAHFLEHKMFTYQNQDVDALMKSLHAETNAYTTAEYTCYYFDTVRDWRKPLKLLLAFTTSLELSQESIDKEKGIILSEYGQFFSDPENRMMHQLFFNLYQNHPLKYDVLGSRKDIADMSLDDLQGFYSLHYTPDQMVISGAGPAPFEEVVNTVEEYFRSADASRKPASKALMDLPEEPETVFKKDEQLSMDVEIPLAGFGIKMEPVQGEKRAFKEDLMLNLWLISQFSAIHPQITDWMQTGLISGLPAIDADLSPMASYVQIIVESMHPEAIIEKIQAIFKEKPEMSDEDFDSIQTELLSSLLRSKDRLMDQAEEALRYALFDLEPEQHKKTLLELDAKQINDWLKKQDFSNQSTVLIFPEEEKQLELAS